MIISHSHRFIFIHCRKVAGSSVKVTLAPHLGLRDILLGSRQELLRDACFLDAHILREFLTREGLRQLIRGVSRGKNWRAALNKVSKQRYKNNYGLSSSVHPPAVDIRDAFPGEWESYFKFCFVRNPYERVVSDYLYLTRKSDNPPDFSDYIKEVARTDRDLHGRNKHDNWPMYTIDNAVAVDFVGRYENLHSDFEKVMETIGLPGLQLTGSEKRRAYQKPWFEYYREGDMEVVYSLYEREIEEFGYGFPSKESELTGDT